MVKAKSRGRWVRNEVRMESQVGSGGGAVETVRAAPG